MAVGVDLDPPGLEHGGGRSADRGCSALGRRSGPGVARRRRAGTGLVGRRGPPQHGPHPGHQLPQPVGLGHVVVRPHLEADHGVDLGSLGGDHDDRHRRPGPDRPAHVDARQPGQHQVEQDQVGFDGGEQPQRLVAVTGHGHVEALAGQPDDQGVDEGLVVLGQQHLGLR